MQTDPVHPVVEPIATLSPLPAPGEKRRIDLHRRRAEITTDRIDIRPSRSAIIPPLTGFIVGAACIGLIVLGVTANAIPYWLLAILLLIALVTVPLTGITLVYALMGANVIFDRAKQSGTWQQGLLGMGIGTTELVPFWKIHAVVVTEAGEPLGSPGRATEEFSQWEVVLLKESGKQLPIAGMTVPRQFGRGGYGPVKELADAIAALTGSTVRVETLPAQVTDRTDKSAKNEQPPSAVSRRKIATAGSRDATPRRRTRTVRRS